MWTFLIVAVSCGFVTNIVRMGLKHNENIERIKNGYPPINADSKWVSEVRREAIEDERRYQ